ncbi:MAG: serine/threonine-protein kinase [Myxococcota bacterium]
MGRSDEQSTPAAALGKAATVAVESGSRGVPSPPSGDDITLLDGEAPRFEPMLDLQQLGRYTIMSELGRGGMGSVYEAFDRNLDRRIAVKVLHRDVGWTHAERLRREAQALARLSHPNVVQVYEVGEAKGQTYIAMELVEGQTLRQWAERQPRPGWRECVAVYLQAGQGLSAAHDEGLVHRDFKPSNAVMDGEGRVRVLDFGLAREVGDDSETSPHEGVDPATPPPSEALSALDTPLTQTGVVMGTPAYMPVEQLRGQDADARSDQFAFCVALYEALYGERPFAGHSTAALMLAVGGGDIRPAPRGHGVPTKLRQLIVRGLAAAPEDRWPTTDALLVQLRRLVAPRTRRWLMLGLAGGLGLAGVGLSQYAAVGFRCDGARRLLDGAWDAERHEAVGAAITATGIEHAAETWPRVEQRLDAYADAWVAKQTEVCESTRVTEQQSESLMELRMACLSTRRVALRETTEVLAKANAARVNQALNLVDSLPSLGRCDDVEALAAEVPLPEDPAVAREVEMLREQLDRARLLAVVGEFTEGLQVTERVVARADALDYAPLRSEALLRRAQLYDAAGRYTEAYDDTERAYLLAVEHRHETVELAAVTELIHAVGERQSKPEAALQWSKTALALAREPLDRASVLARVGSIYKDQGKLDEALDHQLRALAIREEALGPEHPAVASSLNGVAAILRRQGKLDEALEHHRRALAIREAALGPRHPMIASSLNNMSNVLVQKGQTTDGRLALEKALAIREETLGPTHPKLGTILSNLGELFAKEGDYAGAHVMYARARAVMREGLGPTHPRLLWVIFGTAEAYELEGRLGEAAEHYALALDGWEQVRGHQHPDVVPPLLRLAVVELARGDEEAAREHAQRALTIRESGETDAGSMAEARFVAARALWGLSEQRGRARALAELARGTYGGLERATELAEVETWLAEHMLEPSP